MAPSRWPSNSYQTSTQVEKGTEKAAKNTQCHSENSLRPTQAWLCRLLYADLWIFQELSSELWGQKSELGEPMTGNGSVGIAGTWRQHGERQEGASRTGNTCQAGKGQRHKPNPNQSLAAQAEESWSCPDLQRRDNEKHQKILLHNWMLGIMGGVQKKKSTIVGGKDMASVHVTDYQAARMEGGARWARKHQLSDRSRTQSPALGHRI